MKRLLLLLTLLPLLGVAQTTPGTLTRVPLRSTVLGINFATGNLVITADSSKLFISTTSVINTESVSNAPAKFKEISSKWHRQGGYLSPDILADKVSLGARTATEQLEITNNFRLPVSTGSTVGVIYKAGNRFIHDYGTKNTFLGIKAGNFTLTGSGEVNSNTGIGYEALDNLTSGYRNTAVGDQALTGLTSGANNIAVGWSAMAATSSGSNNTSIGTSSMSLNNGSNNTAVGYGSLGSQTSGNNNTMVGTNAGSTLSTGEGNTGIGMGAVRNNGSYNSGVGVSTLYGSLGIGNIAFGYQSGYRITSGDSNLFLGTKSGYNNLLQKVDAINSIAIGANTYTTANYQVVLGNSLISSTILRGTINAAGTPDGTAVKAIGIDASGNYIKYTAAGAQIQSDWNQSNSGAVDYIKNKPTIPAAQIQSDWNQTNNALLDYIKNKPTIPTGESTTVNNLSGGDGLVYKDMSTYQINLRSIKEGTGIDVSTKDDTITIRNTAPEVHLGDVTSVAGTWPLYVTGTTAPTININQASSTDSGYITNTKFNDWDAKIGGAGTAGYVSRFITDTKTLTNSLIRDDGSSIGVGTAPSPYYYFKVNGDGYFKTSLLVTSSSTASLEVSTTNSGGAQYPARITISNGYGSNSGLYSDIRHQAVSSNPISWYTGLQGNYKYTFAVQDPLDVKRVKLSIDTTGNMVLGTASAQAEKLYVQGRLKVTDIPLRANQPTYGYADSAGLLVKYPWPTISGSYVTSVGATSPLQSSGGTTPTISVKPDSLSSWYTKMNQGATAYGWGNHASAGYITDGNTGWDNSYGFITDGNQGWDNSYGFITSQPWSSNGSKIYYNSGNVGIGASDPTYLLTVNGSVDNYLASFLNSGASGSGLVTYGINGGINATSYNGPAIYGNASNGHALETHGNVRSYGLPSTSRLDSLYGTVNSNNSQTYRMSMTAIEDSNFFKRWNTPNIITPKNANAKFEVGTLRTTTIELTDELINTIISSYSTGGEDGEAKTIYSGAAGVVISSASREETNSVYNSTSSWQDTTGFRMVGWSKGLTDFYYHIDDVGIWPDTAQGGIVKGTLGKADNRWTTIYGVDYNGSGKIGLDSDSLTITHSTTSGYGINSIWAKRNAVTNNGNGTGFNVGIQKTDTNSTYISFAEVNNGGVVNTAMSFILGESGGTSDNMIELQNSSNSNNVFTRLKKIPRTATLSDSALFFADNNGKVVYGKVNGGISGTVTVPQGGTGATSFTSHSLLVSAATSTGTITTLTSGSDGQHLRSNGASAYPSWEYPVVRGTYCDLLTANTTDSIARFDVTGGFIGGAIKYTVVVVATGESGTIYQVLTATANYAGRNDSEGFGMKFNVDTEVKNLSSGTLTVNWNTDKWGDNVTLTCVATTSLEADNIYIYYNFIPNIGQPTIINPNGCD